MSDVQYRGTALERFLPRVQPVESGCWLWTGGKSDGYGAFYHRNGSDVAHRFSYEWFVGPIPDGLTIDHLCRVRACVNPDHLEPVTNKENILRGASPSAIHARQTECISGHPFDDENTYYRKNGSRMCRRCIRIRFARAKEASK